MKLNKDLSECAHIENIIINSERGSLYRSTGHNINAPRMYCSIYSTSTKTGWCTEHYTYKYSPLHTSAKYSIHREKKYLEEKIICRKESFRREKKDWEKTFLMFLCALITQRKERLRQKRKFPKSKFIRIYLKENYLSHSSLCGSSPWGRSKRILI